MKLFAKYSRINLLFTIIIFILGSLAFSLLLRYVIISQIDEDLKIEKHEIITYANRFQHLPAIIEVHDQYTTYKPISLPPEYSNYDIRTRKLYNAAEKEKELVRTIAFEVQAGNQWYFVTVSKSLEGTDDLIQSIILITLALILLILAATFLINRIVLRRLWQPFYHTLQRMQQFKLSDVQAPSFANSNIEEFNLLNATLTNAVGKAQQDYQTLKEFTENASHELQTPLAVIRSKLDILIQNEQLAESESAAIQGAYDAVQNLSRLNQSLLLLTKIENKQFEESACIQLHAILENKIAQCNELWQNKNISLQASVSEATIRINPLLLDILLNNLLSNATRHNIQNGSIALQLKPGELAITNSGIPQPLDEKRLFSRFYKTVISNEHLGLGLSIARQICEVAQCNIHYHFTAPHFHRFTVSWQ